jgi:hypothetical protein
MSLYTLQAKPGNERYRITVGWNPHRSFFARVEDDSWNPDTDPEPDYDPVPVNISAMHDVREPDTILAVVEPYAVVPDHLIYDLRSDMRAHPIRW